MEGKNRICIQNQNCVFLNALPGLPERPEGLGILFLVVVPSQTKIFIIGSRSPHDVVVIRHREAGSTSTKARHWTTRFSLFHKARFEVCRYREDYGAFNCTNTMVDRNNKNLPKVDD